MQKVTMRIFTLILLFGVLCHPLFSQQNIAETDSVISPEEKNWIFNNQFNTIGYLDDYLPFCDKGQGNEMEGLLQYFSQKVLEQTGLHVNFKPYKSYDKLLDALEKKEVEGIFPWIQNESMAKKYNVVETTAIAPFPVVLMYKGNAIKENPESFSVQGQHSMMKMLIQMDYPDAKIIKVENEEECIRAVHKEWVDCTISNSHFITEIMQYLSRYNTIRLKNSPNVHQVSFAFLPEYSTMANIFSEVRENIEFLDISSIIVLNARMPNYRYTFHDFYNDYGKVIFLTLLLIAAVIFILLFGKNKIQRKAEKEIKTAKQALLEAYEAADLAKETKSSFLSKMSHDIRTPMNEIMGMTTLASANIDDKEKVKECLGKITVSSSTLITILNEILDMSKIDSGKIDLKNETFNITESVNKLMDENQFKVISKNIALSVNINTLIHETVIGDKERLENALSNILDNSIKFTPEGGHISVTVSERKTDTHVSGCYEFIFEDNGIGIDEKTIPQIFDPFTRSQDKRVSETDGNGLGLSIAKNIVTMMNGNIKVESKLNKGSKFIVTVFLKLPKEANSDTLKTITNNPILTSEGNEKAFEKIKNSDFSGKKILLVEDNIVNSIIITEILLQAKATVESVSNGAIALERVKSKPENYYNLILMDIQMPVMDGLEATRQIRHLPLDYTKKVPIIAVSANAFTEDVKASLDAGMNSHLAKPVDFEKLYKQLKKWL